VCSIIGVQAFRGSFLRHCVWTGKELTSKRAASWYNNVDINFHQPVDPTNATNIQVLQQYCGGYVSNGSVQPYLQKDGIPGLWSKGFICPQGLVCQVQLLMTD
jgi:hypothetical protein